MQVVDDVSKISRGANATITSNYYYPEYTDGECEDSADSDSDNYDDINDERDGSDVDE